MIEKPFYVIEFNAVACFLNIRVNDVPVLSANIEGQVSSMVQINNAIIESGEQHVTYYILPILGEFSLQSETFFEASLWLYDASGEEIEKKEEINKVTMPENTGIPLPVFKAEKFFIAEVPYKLNAWQYSQDLTKVDDLREKVDSLYRKIEEMFANGQYDRFINLIQKREDNIAICMYLTEEEKKERITMLSNVLKKRFEIIPTSPKDIMLIFGHNRLVSLVKTDGTSALMLKDPETETDLWIDMKLHLKPGDTELSII